MQFFLGLDKKDFIKADNTHFMTVEAIPDCSWGTSDRFDAIYCMWFVFEKLGITEVPDKPLIVPNNGALRIGAKYLVSSFKATPEDDRLTLIRAILKAVAHHNQNSAEADKIHSLGFEQYGLLHGLNEEQAHKTLEQIGLMVEAIN